MSEAYPGLLDTFHNQLGALLRQGEAKGTLGSAVLAGSSIGRFSEYVSVIRLRCFLSKTAAFVVTWPDKVQRAEVRWGTIVSLESRYLLKLFTLGCRFLVGAAAKVKGCRLP